MGDRGIIIVTIIITWEVVTSRTTLTTIKITLTTEEITEITTTISTSKEVITTLTNKTTVIITSTTNKVVTTITEITTISIITITISTTTIETITTTITDNNLNCQVHKNLSCMFMVSLRRWISRLLRKLFLVLRVRMIGLRLSRMIIFRRKFMRFCILRIMMFVRG